MGLYQKKPSVTNYVQKYRWNSADKFEFELEVKNDKTGVALVRDMRCDSQIFFLFRVSDTLVLTHNNT
jgi:hypothetical protein